MALTLDIEGPAAPPRLNGELVFDAPWEGRSFAMAMALVEGGLFSWDDFRDHLIAAVQRWESDPVGEYRYYERWQEALESIAEELEIVPRLELDALATAYAARPPGHDHDHADHDHDHDHTHHDHDDHDHSALHPGNLGDH